MIGALRFNLLALGGIVGLAVEVITVSVCDVIVAVIKVINIYSINRGIVWTRADPEGGGQWVQTPPPLKNHKNIGFSQQYWSESPEKSQSYKASIQCWAIMGPPAKRHLNDVSLVGR